MGKKKIMITDLSKNIFWDTDLTQMDWEEHKEFIVERVMGYGQLKDWGILKKIYGLQGIKSIVLKLRNLDDFSIAFLSSIFKIEKEDFRCYKLKQSNPNFWNY